MEVPTSLAAQSAVGKQNMALSAIKHSAEQQEAIAQVLDDTARSAPVNASRGSNFSAKA